ncbi:MAG TPA: orotate phosphoribosyltransferase [candidate division Zixibacteria bacterium]|nr:orotate phosphoribosyltransferase [candidate division Zixibacteria bacterium]
MKTSVSTQNEVLELFERSGALLSGHFLLSSGRHSGAYFEKFNVLQHPEYLVKLGSMFVTRFKGLSVERVIGPTTGGMVIAYEVARQMEKPYFFAEPNEKGDGRVFGRSFSLKPKEKILVVDDVLTTGRSLVEVLELVEREGGEIVGVGVLLDRSGGRVDLGPPYQALATLDVESFAPEECPLCREGKPVTKPGSRKF